MAAPPPSERGPQVAAALLVRRNSTTPRLVDWAGASRGGPSRALGARRLQRIGRFPVHRRELDGWLAGLGLTVRSKEHLERAGCSGLAFQSLWSERAAADWPVPSAQKGAGWGLQSG